MFICIEYEVEEDGQRSLQGLCRYNESMPLAYA